ncbi:MAG TPA: Rrf2 family transcriptional regulator, partial [Gemmatales bacterium]|nr:Rrf2 family transcriptional regulator [Gemmatales bacterium]
MITYGKTTQYAIAAASRLAEVYTDQVKLSSMDIAKHRNLPQPIVAKVLTILSQAGLVTGNPGPRGGYSLAKPPERIRLLDVADCFERSDKTLTCPFGPTYCGTGNPCPLHHQIVALQDQFQKFLQENSLAVFL